MKLITISLLALMAAVTSSAPASAADKIALSAKEQLGEFLFFDQTLSVPEGQSCAVCHGPDVGFTGPDEELNKAGAVYEGAEKGRFGNRKPPASSYAGDSPILHFDKKKKVWVGGMFWDGRATGKRLKDPLAEQAQGPFLNPLEQNLPDTHTLCIKIKNSSYAPLFEKVCGKGSLVCGKGLSATYDKWPAHHRVLVGSFGVQAASPETGSQSTGRAQRPGQHHHEHGTNRPPAGSEP